MFKWICACTVVVIIIFGWLIWVPRAFSHHTQRLEAKVLSFPATCADSKAVDDILTSMHGEEHIWRGVTAPGHLLVIYQSEAGGWTAVVVSTTGRSCVFAAGSDGQVVGPRGQRL